ncbi:unnamed protein product, partial [Coregonus sp. 'balchen']
THTSPLANEGGANKRLTLRDERAERRRKRKGSGCTGGRGERKRRGRKRFVQLGCLGGGGYGTVYAGYRREDNLPVAIKRVPLAKVLRIPVTQDGQQVEFPLEVVLLRIVGGRGEGRGEATGEGLGEVVPPPRAAVALLDWFELDQELVLVLERPVPCMDLYDYIQMRGGTLQEEHARVREREGEGYFGCGCILRDGPYTECYGTSQYTPPEWFLRESYRAGPSTVWQLGVLLYDMLCGDQPFNTRREIIFEEPYIKDELSRHCVDLLRRCLAKRPRGRPTLDGMLLHPWLQPQ